MNPSFSGFVPPTLLSSQPLIPTNRSALRPKWRGWPLKRMRGASMKISTTASSNQELWKSIRSAVPLSQAFSDMLGQSALISTGMNKFKTSCPFHSDRTPSLHIDDSKHTFRCFGCGASGSIIDFEQYRTGDKSISNALRSLADRYPILADIIRTAPLKAPRAPMSAPVVQKRPRKKWRESLASAKVCRLVLADTVTYYEDQFWSDEGRHAREYMLSRGFSEDTLRNFRVGYAAPNTGWDATVRAMEKKGHSAKDCVTAGVARSRKDDSAYDVLRSRVITPLMDGNGDPLAVAGRILPGGEAIGDRVPKYVNGPETAIFKKSEVLYGVNHAKGAARLKGEDGFVLIVEGYMDVLSMYEHTKGQVACVASMGATLSQKQLLTAYDLLEDAADGRVVVNFDGDEAGILAAERLCDSVIPEIPFAHAINIAIPPPGVKDFGEFLEGHGSADDYVDYIMEVALPWYEWRGRRVVLEELDYLVEEREGTSSFEDHESAKTRTMMQLDPSDQSFDFQLSEDLKKQADELVLAFGGSEDLVRADPEEAQSDMFVCKEVVEVLANIVNRAQRCMPGLNAGALVQSWADILSVGNKLAITPLYRTIIARAEELAEPWKELSPQFQLQWMPPPLWVVDDLPKRKRRSIKQASGLDSSGRSMDMQTFMADPKRVKKSYETIEAQEAYLLPHVRARMSEAAKRLQEAPRRSAEEIILRTLIFATESDRLEAMEELLEVMVRCQERDLSFWTSDARESLFEYLVNAEGSLSRDDMAAALEEEEWWTPEIEELFTTVEEESDKQWQSIRMIETENPLEVIRSTASAVEKMAGIVASRVALKETEWIVKKLSEPSEDMEAEEIEMLLAKQISLRKGVNRTKYYSAAEEEEMRQAEEAHRKEMQEKEDIRVILEQLKTRSVPLNPSTTHREEDRSDRNERPF